MSHSRTRSLVWCGLCIALLAVGAFITVPFGPIPFTLQTMILGIIVCLLAPSEMILAIGGYLLLGVLGFPLFAGMRGGLGVLLGPTGGFLLGFFVAALLIAALRHLTATRLARANSRWPRLRLDISSVVILSLVSYALGCGWFMVVAGTSLEAALTSCVVPFLIPDILKALAALVCVQPIRAVLAARPSNSRAEW
ncbi:MAG: biotin transporter BioY [Coriobacteriales bacterium]|nr:biotin transporter BioY [Coriobacteriales bacterium]